MGLVHLHAHSEWSLLDGVGTGETRASRAAELGHPALAITDHGVLSGALYHIEACNNAGIKPIVGMEAYFRVDIAADRERMVETKKGLVKGDRYGYKHLVLLAKNFEGFKNLMRLSSLSYTEDYFYQKPSLDWKAIRDHSEGLIASSSCVSGLLPELIIAGKEEEAKKTLRVFQDIFGEDFFLEIQPHDFPEQAEVNRHLASLAFDSGVPLVATADSHYPYADWAETQDVLVMLNTGSSVKKREKADAEGEEYLKFGGTTFYLSSESELKTMFAEYHSALPVDEVYDAIYNSGIIADRCEHYAYDKSPKIPKATRSVLEAERIIRGWCNEGLERIGRVGDTVYRDRMNEEIAMMKQLKILDYFVIVGDVVRWAKDQGIRVGPGRGSAAGSLVNYLIKITAIDPIGYDLLFERFLNEYRTEIPDIDIDFQHDRRDEVHQYLIDKYGSDYVVPVAAFQSFGFKGVVADVCRVLDIPYMEAKRATDPIPKLTFTETWETLEADIPELKKLFDKYPDLKRHCYRLYGQMKGQSKHAAAVIVTNKPARDLIPMMKSKDGSTVTQWSERANAQLISPYGFLKIDALSTDALTTQQNCIDLIRERHGVNIDFEDPKQFPVVHSPFEVDEDVIQAFASGANLGVFQFSSQGIVGLLKAIKPTNLEHVIAANALYRPGTLINGVAFDYAKRKNGKVVWTLPHQIMREFVGQSFGFMVYQEQVMQIFRVLGKDVKPADAAVFLKVVAKGIARDVEGKAKLQEYYEQFAQGCREKNLLEQSYNQIWDQILQMTTYAFNKSHSAGYALQAYQDMWLKMNYPLEFYACLLSTEVDKVPAIIREAGLWGINVLPPDINTSDVGFTVDGNAIRFGLLAIKYVGDSAIAEIKSKRDYLSYEHFYETVSKAKVKKNVKKFLFDAGAFDSLGGRSEWVLDQDSIAVEGSLSDKERSEGEKAAIGFTVSRKSDVEEYKQVIAARVWTAEELDERDDEATVVVGGEIANIKEHAAKNGTMAFVDLAFGTDDYSCVFFKEKYQQYAHFLVEGNAIFVNGTWDPERRSVTCSYACTVAQLVNDPERE